jgi:tRNA U34 5-carboxymethylaminomethyl modifying GTPase MnmE/TrmE
MKNIPFVPGMYPGIGCSPLTGRLFDSPFKQVDLYSPAGATGQTVEFGLHTVTSTRDLNKKLNFGASVSLAAGGPFSTASAAGRLLREHTVSAHHLYLLVSVVVTHSHEVLTNFTLKPEVSSLLEGKTLDLFRASYGNGFVAGLIQGGCYYGLIEIQTGSLEEKRELAGKLDVQVFAAGAAQLDAERYLTEAIADRKTQISIFRSGGLSTSTGLTLEEMLREASTFPNSVAENPSTPFAIYRDYDDIPPFSQLGYSLRKEHEEYVQCVDYLESLYLQYRDYRETLRSLIASTDGVAILSSLRALIGDKQSAVETDLAGISAQMETIESLIHSCHETTSPCAMPTTLYQLSPEIKTLIDSWIGASEGPKRIEAAIRPAGSNEMVIDRPHYNVAVVGITGVGKSALVNYLFGERVAETGLGRPVTKRGFAGYEFRIGELPVKLFDSWGLEVDKVNEWMESLNEELSLRGTDRPAEDWFHTILFCINAAGSRLQDMEIRVIKRFLESKYQVVVILTKADLLNEEEEVRFAETIRQHTYEALPIIAACSESRKGRRGQTINTFGKEEIEDQIYNNFWDTILARLPQRCRRVVEDYLDKWENSQIERIQERADAGDSLDAIQKDLSNSWDDRAIERLVREEISRTMYVYGQIAESMEYSPGNQCLHLESGDPSDSKWYSVFNLTAFAKSSAWAVGGYFSLAAAPFVIPLGPIAAVGVAIIIGWRQYVTYRTARRSDAIASLRKTVGEQIRKLREGLDGLENGIAKSLENLRMMASNRDNRNVIASK